MKLIRNYIYNMSYNVLILLTPLLTVPYISRVLGPYGVGVNATTNSIITYFLLLGTVGITIYGNREIAFIREDKVKRSKVFWEIEFLQIMTITFAYLLFLVYLFYQKQFRMYFFYQSFLVIAGAFDVSWYFMALEDFRKTVTRNVLVKLASLIAIFTLVRNSNDIGTYILIISLSQLLGNMTLWPYLRHSVLSPIAMKLRPFHHLLPSISLFIPQVAIQIYLALNKTMLWKLDSVTAAGFFDYSDKLIKLVLAIVTATGIVMLPRIANLFAKHDLKKVRMYTYNSFDFALFISIPMAFGIAGVATTLAPWFFGQHFASVNTLLMIESPVIVLIGLSNVIGQQYLLPTKQTKVYTYSVTLGAIVNVVLNIPLIIVCGVQGSMWATVFSELTVTVYQLVIVRRQLHIKKLFVNCWKYLFSGVLMFSVVYMLNVAMKITVFSLSLQIIEGLLIYFGCMLILQPSILKHVPVIFGNRGRKKH
ncbi:oligosaccharide flippase family protein [Lactiplantibacillus plantarum]|uniref:oligosaccharide flippase family protein n=1 Tax=Lactiplantibacillus plantarum TaxID=1590 RepID=UPI001BA74612|nr:polysaccharide biosynthesis C-terminal domain-containing protein [Lactiplantibacillus plantarum]MBS0937189.1 polysaccharide biosynthesis C-terminal domain-containing protein [Lactiplantibacillus plantarum]MBS0944898.1 polysaccharide biosynthesis C-terminal domain-containing protein [Lactiplantibacillus plantarum]